MVYVYAFFGKYRLLTAAILVVLLALYAGTRIARGQYLVPLGGSILLLLLAVGIPNWRWIAIVAFPLMWTLTRVELPLVGGLLSVERLVALPIAAGFLYEVVLEKRKAPRLPAGGNLALIAFTSALFLGLIGNPSGLEWMIRLVQKVVWVYLIFYVLVTSDLRTLRKFSNLLVLSVFIASLFGILMLLVFGSGDRLTERIGGLWLIPSASVTALSIVAPAALLLFAEIEQPHSKRVNLLLLIALLTMLLLPTLTLVRRQTLFITPLALALIFIFGARKVRAQSLVLAGALTIVFLGAVLPNHESWNNRFYARVVGQDIEEEGRYVQLKAGAAALQERPLTGYGLGKTVEITAKYTRDLGRNPLSASHNSYLTMLVDTGVLGFVFTMCIWASLLWGTWLALRRPLEGYLADLVRVLPGLLLFMALQWTVADALRWNPTWTLFGLAWAIIWFASHRPMPIEHGPDTAR